MTQPRSLLAVRQIILAVLCFQIALNFLLPALPADVRSVGGSETMVGLVMATGSVTALLTRLAWPLLGRRVGRVWLLVIGSSTMTVALVSFAFAEQLGALVGLRILAALAMSCFITVAAGTTANLAPADRRGEVMANYGTTAPVAMVVGMVASGTLISTAGTRTAFLAASGAAALSLLCLAPLTRHQSIRAPDRGGDRSLWPKGARTPALALLLLAGANGAVIAFGPPALAAAGLHNSGVFYAVYALSIVLTRRLSGRLGDRRGFLAVAAVGVLPAGIGLLLMGSSPWYGISLVGAVLFGGGLGTMSPNITAWTALRVEGGRAAAMGLLLMGQDIGLTAMTPLSGWISDRWGVRAGLDLLALTVVGIALLLWVMTRAQSADAAHPTGARQLAGAPTSPPPGQ